MKPAHGRPPETDIALLQPVAGRTPGAVAASSEHPDFQVKRLARTGHSVTVTDTGSNNEFHTATHFAPGYFDAMESWLRERKFID